MDYFFKRSLIFFFLVMQGCAPNATSHLAPVVTGHLVTTTPSGFYRVKPHDTLYSIAWNFGKDYRQLAAYNHIKPPYALSTGQRLVLNGISTQKISTPRSKIYSPIKLSKKIKPKNKIFDRNINAAFNRRVSAWRWPAQGKVVTYFDPGRGNKGINIRGAYKSQVRASAAGTVVYSGQGLPAYGKLIILKHNTEYLSAYAHNQSLLVHEGETVTAGQVIALMGHTNNKSVLHFEIRRAGKPVDPMTYLR